MEQQRTETRIAFVDWIRVIACFLVMLVHASENFYGADDSGLAGNMSMLANDANRFWVAFYDGALGRVSVPLFMTISAFLLVPIKSGMSMTDFYRRRFLRIMPPMIIFMLLYCFLPLAWGGMTWETSMNDLCRLPWNFPSMAGHLWFMYPLISLYLIIPVVSPWLEKATAKEERLFLYIFIFSTTMPWLHRFVSDELWGECFWNGFHALWYCSGYLGYLVLAHYIRYHLKWSDSKRTAVGLACFIVAERAGGNLWPLPSLLHYPQASTAIHHVACQTELRHVPDASVLPGSHRSLLRERQPGRAAHSRLGRHSGHRRAELHLLCRDNEDCLPTAWQQVDSGVGRSNS